MKRAPTSSASPTPTRSLTRARRSGPRIDDQGRREPTSLTELDLNRDRPLLSGLMLLRVDNARLEVVN